MQHIKQETKHAKHKSRNRNRSRSQRKATKKQKETNKMAKLIAIALLGHFPKNFVTGFCSFRDTHAHTPTQKHTHKQTSERAWLTAP